MTHQLKLQPDTVGVVRNSVVAVIVVIMGEPGTVIVSVPASCTLYPPSHEYSQ